MNAATICVATAAVASWRNPSRPEAAPAMAGAREMAPMVEEGAAIAFAKPISMPGTNTASGCQMPATAKAAMVTVPASAIMAPARIMRWPPMRPVQRAATMKPANEASAGKKSSRPKRAGDTPSTSIAT